jgi:hypothetical protein
MVNQLPALETHETPRHQSEREGSTMARSGGYRRRRLWSTLGLGAALVLAGRQPEAGRADDRKLAAPSAQAASRLELSFAIDRTGLPPLPYGDITLKVDGLGASAASVTADGRAIPSRLQGGRVVFTTAGRDVVVTLQSPTRTTGVGAFERAVLKDDKAWAWSHGFDDNTNLQAGIEGFRARGWRATLFMICSSISDTRQEENWIVDAPGLRRLLGEGWSVGNHTWDHGGAADAAAARASVVRCSDRLAGIVAGSPRPSYKVIAFAAPNFDAGYAPIIRGLRDSGVTNLLFDESGNDLLIKVDPGATSAPPGAVPFSRDLAIGRYTPIGWDSAATIAAIDSVAAKSGSSSHLWFNSLAHGSNEGSVVPVLQYVYGKYGPGGTNEVLVAPSDEIYSYLVVRDRATINFRGAQTASAPPFGAFDTPADNASGVTGSVVVTGWALDDSQVTKVEIYRSPRTGEPTSPNGKVYIGDASFVAGARPDVAALYPTYPNANRAGWGYMLLSNMLPNLGNGTFSLYAYAYDDGGGSTLLGSKTITCSNASATKPFGTLDTPAQGATVSGSAYAVFGWVLTPQPAVVPVTGSTLRVYVDGAPAGVPTYNLYRSDIAQLFPGYANSGGAVFNYILNTLSLANGIHSIAVSATDNQGHSDGIGSRYFTVQN